MRRKVDLPNKLSDYRPSSKNEVVCEILPIRLCRNGFWTDGVQAVCSKCGQMTESFGTGPKSVNRCLGVMRDKCLNDEINFYVAAKEEKK